MLASSDKVFLSRKTSIFGYPLLSNDSKLISLIKKALRAYSNYTVGLIRKFENIISIENKSFSSQFSHSAFSFKN